MWGDEAAGQPHLPSSQAASRLLRWASSARGGCATRSALEQGDVEVGVELCAVTRRHFSAGANPARQLSLQPVTVGADDGGNDIV